MSKKLKNLKWQSVAIEGFPVSMADKFQGFVGLEECTDYGLDKYNKKTKKKKTDKKNNNENGTKPMFETLQKNPVKKRKIQKVTEQTEKQVPNKKVKLSSGFTVETCSPETPSLTNEKFINLDEKNIKNLNKSTINNILDKKKKTKLGDDVSGTVHNLTPEDMLSWAEFKLSEPILKALADSGFKQPTKIQQLTLPAAIHGRRDILGAAETGSGKTLAFGLPILTGIMKFKEKAESGIDVYDMPYRKASKKKNLKTEPDTIEKKKKQPEVTQKAKESSEDGYSSGEESNNGNQRKSEEIEDFIEEIEVPIRKRETSADEGNDSDDENYFHLSEMLDSDDSADTSDDESKGDELAENGEGKTDDDESEEEGSDEEADDENINENEQGIGCVKVIDNIEMPGQVVVKTGKPLYALILTPTRELAMQVSRHLMAAAKYTGIRIATIVGGMAAVKQERVLRSGPEVVVATPGRLWELLNQGQPHLQQLDSVKFLAIDETDRMVERGHFEELTPLLERLNADDARRNARQNFVFSATLTMVHDLPTHMKGKKVTKRGKILNRRIEKMTPQQKIKKLVNLIGMSDPKVVDITTQLGTAETLTESRIACPLEHKDAYLYYVLQRHPGRTIVFCNSIGSVKRLAQLFTTLKCRPLPLHASMPQRQRLKNLERFRDDPRGVLVATDVAARGLDIPDVDHVIHYQVPRTAENYVHRSGRTARAHKEGLTILMMEPSEAYLYTKLCRTLNKTAEVPTFPVSAHSLAPLKELVALARDLDALELKRRRAAQALGWRDRVAKEMDIIVDDDNAPMKEVDPTIDRALKAKRRQLESMLSRPLFPKGFSFKYPTLNEPTALTVTEDNALQVMKKAIESGELKRAKRTSKNAPLFKLENTLNKKNKKNKNTKT